MSIQYRDIARSLVFGNLLCSAPGVFYMRPMTAPRNDTTPKTAVLVVAAGRGERAGGDGPKQYGKVAGVPVIRRTVEAFLAHPATDLIQIVIHPDDRVAYAEATEGLETPRLLDPAPGGADRMASVRSGLEALAPHAPDLVLIHDAARPFVAHDVIDRVLDALAEVDAAFPALPIVDALWQAEGNRVIAARPREDLWRAQTPQGFRFDVILAAHRAASTPAPDDVTVALAAGHQARVVLGDGNNFKITLPEDFDRANRLAGQSMDIRTGTGFDVHAFGDGTQVILNGVAIPFSRGLKGHSDADVAMHAITDAIFGALAEGDIGRWFPPSEPEWKGAASSIFLEKAVERAAARNYRITSLDCTIICEVPKIGPHAPAMIARLAQISGVAPDRISVKATTSERLGFTGRGEGIAAMATATLVSP